MSEKLKHLIKEEISDVQYFHEQGSGRRDERFTALAEVQYKESFIRLIEGSLMNDDWVMEFYTGYVRVDDRDQYCKKTGREFALKYARKLKFKFDSMMTKDDKIMVLLAPLDSEQSNIKYTLFEIKPSRERVYFVGMELKN